VPGSRAVRDVLGEQPADWTEPGAHRVLDGVHRIALPLPDSALRAVNVYVLDDPDGPVLVDAGWAGEAGREVLGRGLAELGLTPPDLSRIVVTHSHHDHYTLSLELRERYGTTVLLGRGERPSVEAL
jgi:glyoxylase-like metal-dependent hydrolase (beta-lactamase superfamily II)